MSVVRRLVITVHCEAFLLVHTLEESRFAGQPGITLDRCLPTPVRQFLQQLVPGVPAAGTEGPTAGKKNHVYI